MSSKTVGIVAVLTAAIIWSLSGIITKSVNTGPIWMLLIRSATVCIVFTPFIFKAKIKPLKIVFLVGIFYTFYQINNILTTRVGDSAIAVGMQSASTMYIIFYELLKKRDTIDFKKKLIALSIILLGLILSIFSVYGSTNNIAIVFGIMLGIFYLAYSIHLKKVDSGYPLGVIALYNWVTLICAIFLLPLDFRPLPNTLSIGLLIFAGVASSGISYTLYGIGLKRIPLETALFIALLEPVLNPIWVYLGTGYKPPILTSIGLFTILLGVYLNIRINIKKEKEIKNGNNS